MTLRTYKNIHGEYVTWGEDGSKYITYKDFNGEYVTWQAEPGRPDPASQINEPYKTNEELMRGIRIFPETFAQKAYKKSKAQREVWMLCLFILSNVLFIAAAFAGIDLGMKSGALLYAVFVFLDVFGNPKLPFVLGSLGASLFTGFLYGGMIYHEGQFQYLKIQMVCTIAAAAAGWIAGCICDRTLFVKQSEKKEAVHKEQLARQEKDAYNNRLKDPQYTLQEEVKRTLPEEKRWVLPEKDCLNIMFLSREAAQQSTIPCDKIVMSCLKGGKLEHKEMDVNGWLLAHRRDGYQAYNGTRKCEYCECFALHYYVLTKSGELEVWHLEGKIQYDQDGKTASYKEPPVQTVSKMTFDDNPETSILQLDTKFRNTYDVKSLSQDDELFEWTTWKSVNTGKRSKPGEGILRLLYEFNTKRNK